MARSPFQGTWQEGLRPTIVTAPDAIVYINGQPTLMACNSCRRRFDVNKYVTSIQVDLSVDNAPGSANVNLSVPRHTVDDFFVDGVPIVSVMMEIEIYAKGYYLVNGLSQYYPVFWGLITEVSDNYSGGEHTVSINCADILKWWELCRLNINPALTQAAGQAGKTDKGNVFYGMNAYDVIWTLAQQSFGDIVQAKGTMASVEREAQLPGTFSGLRKDVMSYWNVRFGQMRSNLVLYGVEGAGVRGDVIYASQPNGYDPIGGTVASQAVRSAGGGEVSTQFLFDAADTVTPFRSHLSSVVPPIWESEMQTKLEMANVCKEAIGFEFYMDVTGDIIFKPPFYNLDTLGNKPISWIQDIDIIDWNVSEAEGEVITQVQMTGTAEGGPMDKGVTADVNTPIVQVTDFHLLRQFGWRTQTLNAEYMNDNESMFYSALDMLDRINSRRHRATVTIPMRPELRLGFPVYLAPKDQIWYISGISHSLTFGGRAQTQLTLTARRGKFIAPKGIGTIELKDPKPVAGKTGALAQRLQPTARELSESATFVLKVGAAAETPPTNIQVDVLAELGEDPYAPLVLRHPKTGRIVGYPNVVMAYTRPFTFDKATFKRLAGENLSNKRKAEKLRNRDDTTAADENRRRVASNYVQNPERDLIDRHLDNRYIYGMTTAGVYTYVHDKSRVIQEIVQLPATSIDVSSEFKFEVGEREGTATIRPVSDERGFEVIGHYRYGRGISLRDGSLVLTNGGHNNPARVDTQLALAGGLFQTLHAQSQGLTTLIASAGNPADVVARMQVSDLQTAATLNPETGAAEFASNTKNFVDSAPLGSPANQGHVASIEVSQLSRALTIAEMRVKEDIGSEENCACLLGRSDLAFINEGYQVKFLKGTAPDPSTSLRTSVARRVSALREEMAVLDSRLDASSSDPLLIAAGAEAMSQKQLEFGLLKEERQREIEALESDLDSRVDTGEDILASILSDRGFDNSVAERTTLNRNQTITKVETFLANLYEALDGPHQAYEDELRGKLAPKGQSRADAISSNERKPTFSPFSPPFSAPNRAMGGDPAALALQGSSALSDLPQSWKTFGDNLRQSPQRAILNAKIDEARDELLRLTAEEKKLQDIKDSGSVLLNVRRVAGVNVSEQLAAVQAQRAKTAQNLESATLKLRQLEAQ